MAQQLHPVRGDVSDSARRFDYHLSLGTGAVSGWGSTHAYTFAAPSFEYHFSSKLEVFGGFGLARDVNASLYRWPSNTPSYAPRRNGTQAMGVVAGGIYRPSDKLSLAAAAYYLGGQFDPIWNRGAALDLNAYGFSAAMKYRFGSKSSLSIYIDYLHDEAGTIAMPLMMHRLYADPYMWDDWRTHPLFPNL